MKFGADIGIEYSGSNKTQTHIHVEYVRVYLDTHISSVQLLSCVWLCDPMDCSTPGLPVYHQLLEYIPKLMSISRWCHSTISSSVVLFSSCLQSTDSMSQFFVSGGQSIGVSVQYSPSNEHPGLISFRMDWLDLPVVQGTLESLLQHHSSKAPILWCSACFIYSPTLISIQDYWENHSFE